MLKTTEYDVFKFRNDNRNGINKAHVNSLKMSIQENNRLKDHPIKVTRDLQVINGQHRLVAAKELKVPIYYEYVEVPDALHMAIENMNKQWAPMDYLNLYTRNGYKEYMHLAEFMRNMKIPIKFALTILRKDNNKDMHDFKMGNFVFEGYSHADAIPVIWETINILNKHGMKGNYLRTIRFWQALIILFTHKKFDKKKWIDHVASHAHKFVVKARTKDYLSVIQEVYNYRCGNKNYISLVDNVSIDP